MPKFTPGPWFWCAGFEKDRPIDIRTYEPPGYYDNPTLFGQGTFGDVVGCSEYNIIGGETEEQKIANALLIAAAPLLYDALVKITARYVDLAGSGDCGFWDPEEEDEVIQARDAIAKAADND